MMSELLPCPFCGGEAMVLTDSHVIAVKTSIGCQDDECRGFIGLSWLYDTEAEAIAAWNTRCAGTCGNKHKSITSFWCSECDAATSDGFADVSGKVERFNFCPNCGRKVSA